MNQPKDKGRINTKIPMPKDKKESRAWIKSMQTPISTKLQSNKRINPMKMQHISNDFFTPQLSTGTSTHLF